MSDPAAAESGLSRHLATPVLSARRVVDELAQPVGEARLAAALQPIAASLGDSSCLRVTLDGQQIVDVHGDTPLIPASTMKLLTSSVALDVLGADHKYTTTVQAAAAPVGGVVNGDVWLVGGGDPLLTTQDYLGTLPSSSRSGDATRDARRQHRRRGRHADNRTDHRRRVALRRVSATCLRGRSATSAAPEIGPMSALSVNDGFMSNNSFHAAANPAESGAQTLADLLVARGVTIGGVGSGVAPVGHGARSRRSTAHRCPM